MNKPSKKTSNRGDYIDVRWMELRNRALIRDGYKCQACSGVNALQVHHVKYVKGGKIWDSPLKDLVTLCCECHKKIHGILKIYLEPPKGIGNATGKKSKGKRCR